MLHFVLTEKLGEVWEIGETSIIGQSYNTNADISSQIQPLII